MRYHKISIIIIIIIHPIITLVLVDTIGLVGFFPFLTPPYIPRFTGPSCNLTSFLKALTSAPIALPLIENLNISTPPTITTTSPNPAIKFIPVFFWSAVFDNSFVISVVKAFFIEFSTIVFAIFFDMAVI